MPVSKKNLYERSLDKGLDINEAAKSLAYYLFREVIEDAHAKYNISDDEIRVMNRKAVNRAASFLGCIGDDELLASFVAMFSLHTIGWDTPRETADTKKYMMLADEFADTLRKTKGKSNNELAEMLSRDD